MQKTARSAKESINANQKSSTNDKEVVKTPLPRILLVEDDPIIQKVHAHVLEKIVGADVDLASNGQQVLEKFHSNHYDLIVLDGGLPDTDGFELGKIIRREEAAAGKRTSLLLLSAWTYEYVSEGCQAADIDEFAIKPIRFEELKAMALRWLPKKFSAQT